MPEPDAVMRVRADSPDYQRQLQEESEFWDRPQLFSIEACENQPLDPRFDAYTNRRFTGDEAVPWFETIRRYGTFRRGLCLGVSGLKQEARILEQNPSLHLTFCDISAASLARREDELGPRFPGRVATRQADLNFIELPVEQYDVIISSGALHHVLNIEHVAQQAAAALEPGGYFFIQDYVAETQFQFDSRKKALFEAILDRARKLGYIPASWQVVWPELTPWKHSPFEAIRSEDTLDTLGSCLSQVELRFAGALVGLLLNVRTGPDEDRGGNALIRRIAGWLGWRRAAAANGSAIGSTRRTDQRFLTELFLLDELVCDSGIMRPFNAFGVYRRASE